MRQRQHKQVLKMGVGGICEYVKYGTQSCALQVQSTYRVRGILGDFS